MKRHIQETGIRQWAGEDLIELQAEPLKALDSFFARFGACIIEGCQITGGGNSYNIASGMVALPGTDAAGNATFKVVPFSGVSGISLPAYLTLGYSVVDRQYVDGKVKPIAYDYRAVISTAKPAGSYLELVAGKVTRFEDVLQCDATHRFFSDTEREKLKGIAEKANNYQHPSSHPASMIAEETDKKFMKDAERQKLGGIADNANNYNHPDKHPASMITEDPTHRFTTDAEKNKLGGIESSANNYEHPSSHPASMIAEEADKKFMKDAERQKLGGIADNANNYNHPDKHPASMITEDPTHRFTTDAEKNKLGSIESGANNYQHPSSHPASMIAEETDKKFMKDAERTKLGGIADNANNYNHPDKHPASMITEDPTHRFTTDEEKNKLASIEQGANKYDHPANHPASMIVEEANKRFMTDAERSALSSLGTNAAMKDFSNVTSQALGQNGYCKFPNGLLIQWGFIGIMSTNKIVYFPTSFIDNYWSISALSNGSFSGSILSPMLHSKYSSYFLINHLYLKTDGGSGIAGEGIHWIAIGRWK